MQDEGTTKIYFYDAPSERVKEEHVFLNNFAPSVFVLEGVTYDTVEHYYQSKKHNGSVAEEVRNTKHPYDAKKKANSIPFDEEDWVKRKDAVMLVALRAKFSQNPELAARLLATENATLHEDSPRDMYWGVKGEDKLGKMLMEIREELRSGALKVIK